MKLQSTVDHPLIVGENQTDDARDDSAGATSKNSPQTAAPDVATDGSTTSDGGETKKPVDNPLSAVQHDDPLRAPSPVADPLALPSLDDAKTPLDEAAAEAAASLGGNNDESANSDVDARKSNPSNDAAASAAAPDTMGDTFVPWSARTADILSKFSTDERIGVTAKFMEGASNPHGEYFQRFARIKTNAHQMPSQIAC